MISHAIFASSHPTSPRTASSSTPPSTPRSTPPPTLPFALHLAPRFTPHPSLHSHPASHHALHPAPRPTFPSLSLSQVSSSSRPPISHPHVSPPSVSLSQAPPADFLVRKKAKFTHDMTFFHHDVRGKRFNTHGASHNMEMSSVKTMWQRSPGGGGTSGGMVAHDLVNGCQATA